MTRRVHLRPSSASETCFWVLLSRAEVASSNIRIRGFGAMARAIMMRCFWPPEMPPWPSEMMVCMPMGMALMSSAMPASSAASQASSSVSCGAEMTMLEYTSPWKRLPSCVTTPMRRRSERRSSLDMSLPS